MRAMKSMRWRWMAPFSETFRRLRTGKVLLSSGTVKNFVP